MIRLTGVRKIYQRKRIETVALSDINVGVAAGEFVAITGPSGCGKSTLLNVLGIMDAPTSGAYLLDGMDVYKHSERHLVELRNRHIGFIFQSFNLLESPTVFENVELPLIYRKMEKKERRVRVAEVLESLKLRDFTDFHPTELSGGEQQRVAVAIAIAGLIGLAFHVLERRTHEIGVRKTLGASVGRITAMLLQDFSRPVIVANLIAWPLAFIAVRAYVEGFVRQTAPGPGPYVLGLLITVGVVCAAVIGQSIRAARVPPASILRHE